MRSVKVLMETIVVAFSVLEQQRRRFGLSSRVATIEKLTVFCRITYINTHSAIPAIRNRDQMRVNRRPKFGNQIRQRITEILVFASPETVPRHYDPAAKAILPRIQPRNRPAFFARNKIPKHGATLRLQILPDIRPIPLHFDSNVTAILVPDSPILAAQRTAHVSNQTLLYTDKRNECHG